MLYSVTVGMKWFQFGRTRLFCFFVMLMCQNVNTRHSSLNIPSIIGCRSICGVHRKKGLRHLLNLDKCSICSPFMSRQSWIRPTSEWRTDQCMYTVRRLTDTVILWIAAAPQHKRRDWLMRWASLVVVFAHLALYFRPQIHVASTFVCPIHS